MMKISRKTVARWTRETVHTIQYVMALPALYLVASLVPGDRIGFNVVGTIGLLVIVGVIDAVISLPLLFLIHRLERPVLDPVEW
jgi:hypothetical protein